jgi:desulfoferrodoxin-like iron-binding protein
MRKGQVYACLMCGNTVEVVAVGGGKLACCGVAMEKQVSESPGTARKSADAARRHVILGVHVTDRAKHAASVQGVLSDFGAGIKTRLGLHEVQADCCSPNGLMLVEFTGDDQSCEQMLQRLSTIEGVEAKRMVFDHP